MLTERWSAEAWPKVRAEFKKALTIRSAIWRAGWLPPVLLALHRWLDTWRGIGHLVVGMARQGFDLQLTRYDEQGWRATFYTSGMEHSPTSATGTAWKRAPWRAVQRAAWQALNQDSPRAASEGKPG